ncbi:MAG: hypothetical protein LBQ24_05025 [Candidatus Peribacteria bacterium]|jgi:hypothetical protein|nr:hypothetical protein [Candidatus Peribacteria bacterium]
MLSSIFISREFCQSLLLALSKREAKFFLSFTRFREFFEIFSKWFVIIVISCPLAINTFLLIAEIIIHITKIKIVETTYKANAKINDKKYKIYHIIIIINIPQLSLFIPYLYFNKLEIYSVLGMIEKIPSINFIFEVSKFDFSKSGSSKVLEISSKKYLSFSQICSYFFIPPLK